MRAMPDETTDLLIELHGLWDDEHSNIKTEWDDHSKIWEVRLSALIEYDNPHNADWAEYTWVFPDDTLDQALDLALVWCRELEKLRRCSECDGRGRYWTDGPVQAICEHCDGTGLAHPPTLMTCDSSFDDPENEREYLAEFGVEHFHHRCAKELPHRRHGCGLCATEWTTDMQRYPQTDKERPHGR